MRPFAKVVIAGLAATLAAVLALVVHVLNPRPARKADEHVTSSATASPTRAPRGDLLRVLESRSTLATQTPTALPPEDHGASPAEPVGTEAIQRQLALEISAEMEHLRNSGPPRGNWTTTAANVFQQWKDASPLSSHVQFSDFSCFAGGCSMTATYASRAEYEDVNHEFQESESFKSWSAPKYRSGPVLLPSGSVQAVWILYQVEPTAENVNINDRRKE